MLLMYNTIMTKEVRKNVLNYRVIIEKETNEKGEVVYNASCPTLGVFDYGNTIDEVMKSIRNGIESIIEFLTEQKREIPIDYPEESIVTFTQVEVPKKAARLAVA